MKSAVEYLIEELEGSFSIIARAVGVKKYNEIVRKSLEMEKQQIIDAYKIGECEVGLMIVNKPEQYYNETYGSKGSGMSEKPINHTNSEIPNHIFGKSLGKKYEEYQEWLNEVPEISDEEIEARVKEVGAMGEFYKVGYRDACKWYRKQLKK